MSFRSDSGSFNPDLQKQFGSRGLPGLEADDPGAVVRDLFRWSQRLVGIDGAVFFLVDDGELQPSFGFELPTEVVERLRLPMETDGPIQVCVTESSTRVLDADVELKPGVTNPWKVAVCIPLAIESAPIGAYLAGWNAPFDIGRDTLLVLEGAASMAASSIHRARLLYRVKREEQRLRTLLDRLPIPAVGFSTPELTVNYVNAECRQLLGDAQGRSVLEVLDGLSLTPLDGTPVTVEEAIEGLNSSTRFTRFQMSALDGSTRIFFPHVARFGASGGVIMLVDVTQEASLEMQRKRFVRMISHHLRTPLTPLMGFAEIVSDEAREHSVQQAASDITAAVAQITGQVERLEQIADLQPLDEGNLSTSTVKTIVESAWTTADGGAGDLSLTGEHDLEVVCDADYVIKAMSEIFMNSYQHGRPPIDVNTTAEDDNAVITCGDAGDGISSEWQSAIFAPYLTTQGGYKAPPGGQLGLGLTLARALIEATLGQLTYEDGDFVVRLPLAS